MNLSAIKNLQHFIMKIYGREKLRKQLGTKLFKILFDLLGQYTSDNPHVPKAKNQGVVGVDLGVSNLATLSTGESITGIKSHKSLLIKLRNQ